MTKSSTHCFSPQIDRFSQKTEMFFQFPGKYQNFLSVLISVISLRNILHVDEPEITASTFLRPFDCAIFLWNGGHFAAAVFEKLVGRIKQ